MDRDGGVRVILGRTPEGLIKIKKDDPLGLRAVNCACCSTCGCDVVRSRATPELIEILQNATGATMNGIAPSFVTFLDNAPNEFDWPLKWVFTWCLDPSIGQFEGCNYFIEAYWYGWETDPTSPVYNCFGLQGIRYTDPPIPFDTNIRYLVEGVSSCPPILPLTQVNSETADFTINGEKFPCYQSFYPATPLEPLAIPNFVFT